MHWITLLRSLSRLLLALTADIVWILRALLRTRSGLVAENLFLRSPSRHRYRFLIHDRHGSFSPELDQAVGILESKS